MDVATHFIISFAQQGLYLAAQFNSCLDAAWLHGGLGSPTSPTLFLRLQSSRFTPLHFVTTLCGIARPQFPAGGLSWELFIQLLANIIVSFASQ
jgi:hypothetical protein